jgi:hypothetical protein
MKKFDELFDIVASINGFWTKKSIDALCNDIHDALINDSIDYESFTMLKVFFAEKTSRMI